jgi:hypothetical protein
MEGRKVMPKYRAYGTVVGEKYLGEIEAANEEEAKEKAFNLGECYISLCHQCSSECEDGEIHEVNVELVDENQDD